MRFNTKDYLANNQLYKFLFILTMASTIAFQAWRTLFNNFAVEVANVDSVGIGIIQGVREIPGFLAFLIIYLLIFINEQKLTIISIIVISLGVLLTGFFPHLNGLIITTFAMSLGFHYFQSLSQSLVLQHFSTDQSPFVLASLRKFGSLFNIITGVCVLGLSYISGFSFMYLLFGGIALAVALWSFKIPIIGEKAAEQNKKIVLRSKYWLFYILTFLSGARRQIFIVFAVFLMVEKFNFSVAQITILFVVNNIVNFFVFPYIAQWIHIFGERKVLTIEYIGMIIIFSCYIVVESPIIIALLYILDNIIYNFSLAIKTYFHKIANPKDIASSTSVGFTINHIAAVVIPFIGGVTWIQGYQYTFLLGVGLGVLSLIFSRYIKTQ